METMNQISIGQIREWISRRKNWIIFPTLIISVASLVLAVRLPKIYRSTSVILVQPQRFPEPLTRTFDLYKMEQRLRALSEIIYSRTLLQQVIDAESLYTEWAGIKTPDEMIEAMRKDIHIDIKANDVFRITYEGKDPVKVMRATNQLARQFIVLLKEQVNVNPGGSQVAFLELRLKELYTRLAELQMTYTNNYPELINLRRKISETEAVLEAEKRSSASVPSAEGDPPLRNSEARIVDEASLPFKPFKPNRTLFAVAGSLLGLGAGLGLALLAEWSDHTFRSGWELQAFLGLPVLVCIPKIETPRDLKRARLKRRFVWGLGLAFIGLILIYFYQSPAPFQHLDWARIIFLER